MMLRKLACAAVLAAAVTTAAQAADLTPGMTLGVTPPEIANALAAEGYKLVKFEHEHGRIEVKAEAAKTGRRMEIKLDPATGKITRIKDDD